MATSELKNNASIVESGTEGIWEYRKWSDGTAECWGTRSIGSGIAINNVYGNGYYSAEINQNFPTDLFVSTPCIQVTSEDGGGYGTWFNVTINGTSKDKLRGLMYAIASVTVSVNLPIYAIGKWK